MLEKFEYYQKKIKLEANRMKEENIKLIEEKKKQREVLKEAIIEPMKKELANKHYSKLDILEDALRPWTSSPLKIDEVYIEDNEKIDSIMIRGVATTTFKERGSVYLLIRAPMVPEIQTMLENIKKIEAEIQELKSLNSEVIDKFLYNDSSAVWDRLYIYLAESRDVTNIRSMLNNLAEM